MPTVDIVTNNNREMEYNMIDESDIQNNEQNTDNLMVQGMEYNVSFEPIELDLDTPLELNENDQINTDNFIGID